MNKQTREVVGVGGRLLQTKHAGIAAAILGLMGAAPIANAADLPLMPVKAPVPAAYNWTGLYFGINGGYGWGQQDPFNVISNRFDNFDVGFSGGMFGGTAGAQIQLAHVLLGFEADIDWANINGSSAPFTPTILGLPQGFTVTANTSMTAISTARARVGYAAENWLLYVTGGVALLDAKTTLTSVSGTPCGTLGFLNNCSGSDRRIGGAVGAGIEYGFSPNWSAKVEYLYVAAASLELSNLNMVRAGINYRFGGF